MSETNKRQLSKEESRISRIIEMISENNATAASGHIASLGTPERDDCAVIPISPEFDIVVGTDFVRGTGFYLFQEKILNYFDIGYYLVGANASDLAAMGATPTGFLSVIRYTPNLEDEEFDNISRGIISACKEFNMPLLGGDTGGYNEIVLSGTAIGVCPKGKALKRSAGCSGDQLFITGPVGRAAAAITYFTKLKKIGTNFEKPEEDKLAMSWKRVEPALKQSQSLVKHDLSSCAIDTSDGLKASLRQIAEASNLDAVISPSHVPVDILAKKVAKEIKVDPFALAIGDSVDFRVLFSTPKRKVEKLISNFRDSGWELYHIGEFRKPISKPGAWQETENGLESLPGVEWDQSEIPSIDRLLMSQSDT